MARSTSDLLYYVVVGLLAACALLILVGPVLVALATSFTSSASLKFPPPGFSLRWYAALLDPVLSGHIHRAALNSFIVALAATVLAVCIAVPAALALRTIDSARSAILDTIFMSPMVLPLLAYGLATLIFFSWMSVRPSLVTLIIGHTIVVIPIVLRTTTANLVQLDKALWECSESLGASAWFTFRRTTLPLIAPGVLAGAFLAFVLSFDNVPVSIFLSSVNTDMLPIRMWGMMETSLDVRVAAISGVLIVVAIVSTIVMERLVGITRRLEA
jgi:putative spermidine/putrescine transport system permease protein